MNLVAAAFDRAAPAYEAAAATQRVAALRLARRIAALDLPPAPRVLDVGAGTGFLARALAGLLPDAVFTVTDIAPAMVRAARANMPWAAHAVMDAGRPAVAAGRFDLVCSSLALQWMDAPAVLGQLALLLAPGGFLAVNTLLAGSVREWREAAGQAECYPTLHALGARGFTSQETLVEAHASGLDFLRHLRRIGAHRAGAPVGGLRAALRRLGPHPAVSYEVGTVIARPTARGVFVTGTDTGVGKTLAAACLARAWGADYWKPAQTGLEGEEGDTAAVARLAGLSADRLHPPTYAFDAALSPHAAARQAGMLIEMARFRLPTARPLVVEGAGGVLVPITAQATMVDLMQRLGLPVVLVARGGLGTINHTRLSIEALRARGIPLLGVILNGDLLPGNREAIEAYAPVLACWDTLSAITPDALATLRVPAAPWSAV